MNFPNPTRPQISNSVLTFLCPLPSVASCSLIFNHIENAPVQFLLSCLHDCNKTPVSLLPLHTFLSFLYRANFCGNTIFDNTTHCQTQKSSMAPFCVLSEVHSLAFKIVCDLGASSHCHFISSLSGTLNRTRVSVTKHTFLYPYTIYFLF